MLAVLGLLNGCATVEKGARTANRAIGKTVEWITGKPASPAPQGLEAPSQPPALEPAGGTFRTTAHVRLRTGPGTRYRVLSMLAPDTRVTVLGRVKTGGWLKVRTASGEGYIAERYLEPLAEGSGIDRLPPSIDSGN